MQHTITHIVSKEGKWAIKKSKAIRATKIFKHRERAFHYAMLISDKVIVHNPDGTVLFIEDKRK